MPDRSIPIQQQNFSGHKIRLVGSMGNLNLNLLGLLCSRKCPGELILKSYDTARLLREAGQAVLSGFHSPIEKDMFSILLRGTQPVILCLARFLDSYRIPVSIKPLIENGRLTIIAPDFSENEKRVTHITSDKRNAMIFNICDQVLVIHAWPGGSLDQALDEFCIKNNKIFALSSHRNQHLFSRGVLPWKEEGS